MSAVLIGGVEMEEKDAERIRQLLKDTVTQTAYEIKQQAWELAISALKTDFSKEWCKQFVSAFPNNIDEEKAYLLDDLTNIYINYKRGTYTLEESKTKVDRCVQSFVTKVCMREIG
jgi:hypothetical protein